SYAELDARANRLARLLVSRGVGAESVVAVCLDRGVDAVVALLGVMKAGGAYLPVDPGYPAERVAYMLDSSQAVTVVTTSAHEPALPAGLARLVVDDPATVQDLAAQDAGVPGDRVLRPGNPAYVIFTSGSTGRPKG
ncbi:AMP-binding protein, partial [Streptomyces sp. SID5643]|uniref:AMP-binding protein n=1 Tax=Streptomyces sp. SID5643 TaxID=2690307 RepID=UPI00136878AF